METTRRSNLLDRVTQPKTRDAGISIVIHSQGHLAGFLAGSRIGMYLTLSASPDRRVLFRLVIHANLHSYRTESFPLGCIFGPELGGKLHPKRVVDITLSPSSVRVGCSQPEAVSIP